ncbi:MAG: hypothetical protein A2114_00300 [Candidatus Vogelbacteria bacterium GWA1_51_14]|uniref:DUF4134 domain-containing protein n=1 Tax=Candidatus Vogelbacteria bacterium GWA1_51_14 TaxID=1802435 RepID=A0A1G2Q8S9_9BACT|nr:MAG: hypothetical protein A2114_00300 [Candidatus Vogelbacteria bacterium GWA1_51_14]
MKSFLKVLLLVAVISLPVMVLAQGSVDNLGEGFEAIIDIINSYIIPLIIGVAGLIFMIGVIKYVTAGDDAAGREGARNMMVWGIIALFVMISVWGLVNLLVGTFNLDSDLDPRDIPTIPSTR